MMPTYCRANDVTYAEIISAKDRTPAESAAIRLLIEEVEKRTRIAWKEQPSLEKAGKKSNPIWIVIGRRDQIPALLPPGPRRVWTQAIAHEDSISPAEGFVIHTLTHDNRVHDAASPKGLHTVLVIAGNDSRGILFGIGYLLRKLELSPGHATLSHPIDIVTAPQYPIRSHQIGYRFKNNTYDAWTLPMFEQHIRDLAIFGTNTIQLIAPVSDDALTSPLYPAPALDTVLGISRILDKYGLNCDLYYPEMAKDYSDPQTVEAELKTFETLVRQFPRLDALYVPGGDPGHTQPKYLFPLVEKEAQIVRKYHPGAKVWISAQGFDEAAYEDFYALLNEQPSWLTGVFFGPQSRDSFETQRARIPSQYPLLFYPDIAHTMHAQFPVPDWDPAFALLEGREPINPRPVAYTEIYRHFAKLNTGFVTYSEGVNDDVNKFIWIQLGWSDDAKPEETLCDYSRYFLGAKIGSESSDSFADGILALEQNWNGPASQNPGIEQTLRRFQHLEEEASPEQRNNWRFESALYRADYDAYTRQRELAETDREEQALAALSQASSTGSAQAIEAAQHALSTADSAQIANLRSRIFDLAQRLFDHVRIQLSAKLYGASGIERGANLDRIDTSLNDRVWMAKQFAQIRALPSEQSRLQRISEIVHWESPVPGTLYDDLGDPQHEPHLVRGTGFAHDPELYNTAINGIADMTPDDGWRMSWITYAETLYEKPIELNYHGLDPKKHYTLHITYAGEDYHLPMRLVANDNIEIHPPLDRKVNPETVEFSIPPDATRAGNLNLKWTRPPGLGGSGRGHQIAEAWLIPES